MLKKKCKIIYGYYFPRTINININNDFSICDSCTFVGKSEFSKQCESIQLDNKKSLREICLKSTSYDIKLQFQHHVFDSMRFTYIPKKMYK